MRDDTVIFVVWLTTMIAGGIATALAVATSFLDKQLGYVFACFNFFQLSALSGLIDVDHTTRLDQYLHGFEFFLLMLPKDASLFKSANGAKEPLSYHLQSYGFFSSLFFVLHFVALLLVLVAVVTWIVLRIVFKQQSSSAKAE